MRILAIETSCDETAVAILSEENGGFVVEKNIIASQISTHARFGGVVPEVAARMHMEALFPMLIEAGVPRDGEGIDVVAVTAGPGLVVALRVGVETAKALAVLWKKPLVAVNHLEGHIASAWLNESPTMPVLALTVSGGHTEIVLMKEMGDYEILGETRDDAAGEAFDKVAKMMGLGYPGGPIISKRAILGKRDAFNLPRPMIDQDNFDFSFSGLKTAVLREVQMKGELDEAFINDMAASFEEAVVETLVTKTMKAVEKVQPASVILVGGVSANTHLRERLTQVVGEHGVHVVIPERAFSTDNATMIAAAGIMKAKRNEYVDPLTLKADPHLHL